MFGVVLPRLSRCWLQAFRRCMGGLGASCSPGSISVTWWSLVRVETRFPTAPVWPSWVG